MTKIVGMIFLVIGIAGAAMANPTPAPEIDPGSCASALALLSGAILVVRDRRKN